jgi:hypothetical protein
MSSYSRWPRFTRSRWRCYSRPTIISLPPCFSTWKNLVTRWRHRCNSLHYRRCNSLHYHRCSFLHLLDRVLFLRWVTLNPAIFSSSDLDWLHTNAENLVHSFMSIWPCVVRHHMTCVRPSSHEKTFIVARPSCCGCSCRFWIPHSAGEVLSKFLIDTLNSTQGLSAASNDGPAAFDGSPPAHRLLGVGCSGCH